MATADIGLIGLAVMGSNLALNIAERGYTVAVHNRTASKIDDFMVTAKEQGLDGKVVPEADIVSFIKAVKRPRSIIIMVKAGKPVDDMIEQLLPMLEPGDAILECGNSLYTDSQRRCEYLKAKGIGFLGIGVMGGEDSGITLDTTDLFLESAFFAPDAIAGRARAYGFSSDASYRFERGVDFALAGQAMVRATRLILDICGGSAGPVQEALAADKLPARAPIRLRAARVRRPRR